MPSLFRNFISAFLESRNQIYKRGEPKNHTSRKLNFIQMKKITLFLEMVLLGFLSFNATAQGSWNLQNNPVQSTANVGKVQFVSATEGWVSISPGFLLHTVDSGTTWTEMANPFSGDVISSLSNPAENLHFINATTGWVIKTLGTESSPQGAVIYKTTNGGTNWQRTVISQVTGDAGIQIQFIDANNGWLIVYNMNTGVPTFLKTTNGGANWSSTNGGGIFYYMDTNTGWAYSAGPTQPPPYTVYKTNNGGTNWIPQYTDSTTGSLNAMQFTDLNHGWIVGDNGKVFATTNGGTTWNVITNIGLNPSYKCKAVFFLNSMVGWISSQLQGSIDTAIVKHTTDGGATWTTQTTAVHSPNSLYFWTEMNGWLTSDDNLLAHYSDTMKIEENSISKIVVYPNPNMGTFYINSYEITGSLSIEISDILGRQVYQNKNYNLATAPEINLDSNRKGIYFLKASDGTAIFTEKIVIK